MEGAGWDEVKTDSSYDHEGSVNVYLMEPQINADGHRLGTGAPDLSGDRTEALSFPRRGGLGRAPGDEIGGMRHPTLLDAAR